MQAMRHGVGRARALVGASGLIGVLAMRELRGHYGGSLLGPAWLLLQPLVMVLVYTVVFAGVMGMRLPGAQAGGAYAYSVYLCAGLLPWQFFVQIVQRGRDTLLQHAGLIRRASFPMLALYVPVVLVAGFNLLVMMALFQAAIWLLQPGLPGVWRLAAPAALFGLLGLALALGLSVLQVFFRDVGHLADAALQLAFWATPIVYRVDTLPGWARQALAWNPAAPLVTWGQRALLGEPLPPVATLAPPAALALLLGAAGLWLHRRLRRPLLDEL